MADKDEDETVEYRFITTEGELREINAVEAKVGMTHEEFVKTAAEFVEQRQSEFVEFSQGNESSRRKRSK